MDNAKKEWKAAANKEIGAAHGSADPKIGFALETNKDQEIRKLKKTLKDKLKKYVDAMKKTQAQATAAMEGVDEATAAAAPTRSR